MDFGSKDVLRERFGPSPTKFAGSGPVKRIALSVMDCEMVYSRMEDLSFYCLLLHRACRPSAFLTVPKSTIIAKNQ